MRRTTPIFVISIFACLLGTGCGAGEEGSGGGDAVAATSPAPPDAGSASPADAEEAKTIFATRCFTCHGTAGGGDGPGSAGLTPKPRNFQDPEWQASVDDDHLGNIILYGGAAVGRSPMMPGNPDLIAKPAVVAALVEHIRTLAPR